MMSVFVICMIFCGCSLDGAFDSAAGSALWLAVFAAAMFCAVRMWKKGSGVND